MTDPETMAKPADDLSGPSVRAVPEGDDRPRLTCPDCGYIAYENPKIIVGSVCSWEDRLLLCRRAIEPRLGFWTLPAGFLELNETTEDGAAREAWEEARARIAIDGVLAVYNIPRISQVQIIYRARLLDPAVAAGPESAEVGLFRWDEVPWDDLAFPSVHWSLAAWRQTAGGPLGQPGRTPADAVVR
ncbi:MAG: NUDIX domain-containing protein [Alphaproteobacteria bacterium]|jgi:ADP-ribose pyrophosphatase YjhB (NUDIX family)|nr:NUDIX domain-containing protein [Alphaproteobacteria bacterium]